MHERKLLLVLLSTLISLGCEIFYHEQFRLPGKPERIAAVEEDRETVCAVLGRVAASYDLPEQEPRNAAVLCEFVEQASGFPLILGARKEKDGSAVLVDVWAWNRGSEQRELKRAVSEALQAAFPTEVERVSHPSTIFE